MAGWITSAVQLGFIAGTLVFAIFAVSDRFSPRRVFLLCAVAGALSNLLTGLAGNGLAWLLGLRFITGFFLAGIYPVGMKIAAGWYQKGLGNALGFLIGALVLGTAFPHLLKGGLSSVPWQAVIVLSSGVCLLGGLLMFLLIPDGPYLVVGDPIQPAGSRHAVWPSGTPRRRLGLFRPHVGALYPVGLCAGLPGCIPVERSRPFPQCLFLELSDHRHRQCGMQRRRTGFGTRGQRAGGLHPAGGLRHLLSFLSPLFTAPPALFLAFMLLWGTAVVGDSPQFSTIVARTAPPELVGSALTLVNCIGFSITVVSLSLMQWIAAMVPPQYLLVLLAAGPAAGLVCMKSLVGDNRVTPPSDAQTC